MRTESESQVLEKRIETGGWGLLFVWVGLALLADVGWGVGLVVAGVIVVAAQLARTAFGLPQDRFAVFVGAMLAFGGLWTVFRVSIAFVPVFCIVAGVALLASALSRGTRRAPRGVAGGPAQPVA